MRELRNIYPADKLGKEGAEEHCAALSGGAWRLSSTAMAR